MTDNEIIKALECCGGESCLGCPYRGKCHQGNPMIRDALDLINRQQAEIERISKEVDRLSQCVLYHDGQMEDAKSEAVKEFAEKIEKAFSKTENQMPNSEVVRQTVQICRNAIRIALKEFAKEGK